MSAPLQMAPFFSLFLFFTSIVLENYRFETGRDTRPPAVSSHLSRTKRVLWLEIREGPSARYQDTEHVPDCGNRMERINGSCSNTNTTHLFLLRVASCLPSNDSYHILCDR